MTQRNQSDKPAGDKPPSRKPAINKNGGSGSITKPKQRSQLSSRASNQEGFGESWVPGTIGMDVNAPNAMELHPQVVGHVEEEVDIELVPEVLYDIFGEIPAVLKGQLCIRMPSLDTSFPQRPLVEVSSVPFEQASRISSSQPPMITHNGTNQLQASSANRSPYPSGAGPWLNKLRPGSGTSSLHAPGNPSFHGIGPSSIQLRPGSGIISLHAPGNPSLHDIISHAAAHPSFPGIGQPSSIQLRPGSGTSAHAPGGRPSFHGIEQSSMQFRPGNQAGVSESLVPAGTIGMAVNAPNAMDLRPQVVGHVKEEVNIELPPLPEALIYGEIPAVIEGQPGMRMPWLDMSFPQRPLADDVSSFQQAISRIASSQRPITHRGITQLQASSANPSGVCPWLNEAYLQPFSFYGMGTSSTLQPVPESGISLHAPRHHPSFHVSGLLSLQLRARSGISSYAFPRIGQPSSIQLRPGISTSSHAPGGHPSFNRVGQSSMQFRPGSGGISLQDAPRHHPSFNALGLPCLQLRPGSGIISSHAPRRHPSFHGIISHAAAHPSFDRIGQSSIQIRQGSGGISRLQAAPEHPSFHGIRPSALQQRERPEGSINSHAPERAPFHFVGPLSNTYDAESALDPLANTADSHRSNPTGSVKQKDAP